MLNMSSWKFKKCKLSLLCSVLQLQVLVPEFFYAYGNKISLPLPLPLASLPKTEIATDFRNRHFTLGAYMLVHSHRNPYTTWGCLGCLVFRVLHWVNGQECPPWQDDFLKYWRNKFALQIEEDLNFSSSQWVNPSLHSSSACILYSKMSLSWTQAPYPHMVMVKECWHMNVSYI